MDLHIITRYANAGAPQYLGPPGSCYRDLGNGERFEIGPLNQFFLIPRRMAPTDLGPKFRFGVG